MQLLFNIDTDVNIQRKMTAIEQESLSLPEKFTNKEIIEKGNDDGIDVVNKNSITNTLDECTDNGNLTSKEHIASNSENISIENLDNENQDINIDSSVKLLSSPTENVSTQSQSLNVSNEVLKEEQPNINHEINLDCEGDKETNTIFKNDVIYLENCVEKNKTNIEIKVDIEVKKDSHENEQENFPTTPSESKENLDKNIDMKTSTSSSIEETSATEETIILKSVLHSKDRIDIDTRVELDTEMEICGETGKSNVTTETDIENIKENQVEDLHGVESSNDNSTEVLHKENNKILEESIMNDSDQINSANIVFKPKETIDETMSTEEMKSDIELCETESNLELSNPIENKTLKIESTFTSCEEVTSELQATSNLEQSTPKSKEVHLRDDVIKKEDETENNEDISVAIDQEMMEVNKEIEKIAGKARDNENNINEISFEEKPNNIQDKELEIKVHESTEVTIDKKTAVVEFDKHLLQAEEISKINDELTKTNNNGVEEESQMIRSIKLETNVDESKKVTCDEKTEVVKVNEPEEEVSKINVKITKNIDIKMEVGSQIKELEIAQESTKVVTSEKNMELIELNEPDLLKKEKVSSVNQVVIDVEEQAVEDVEKDEEKPSKFIKDEIIDIADEIFDVEEIPEILLDSSNKLALASNETDIEKNIVVYDKTKGNKEIENRNLNIKEKCDTKTEDEKITDIENHIQNVEKIKPDEKKKLSHISKLSNTLDILSDEEEDSENVSSTFVKDCINIEDDDDIVLIDEGTIKDECEIKESVEHNNTNLKENIAMDVCENKTDNIVELGFEDAQVNEKELQEQKPVEKELEKPKTKIPILPKTFLNTCKKSFAEMTRDELEEFCIMKIGESVIDRSNLNEIIKQLKTLSSSTEDYKKRVDALVKQNRDLKVIVKSVLEEQKNGSNTPITPLKITRSVGMQVYMAEKPNERKKSLATNSFQSFNTNKVRKRQANQSPKATKLQINSNQHIPVPRLVPAVNNAGSSTNKSAPATPTKIQAGPVPNGAWNTHQIQKPEKRPHSKVQNSVTVDLTDDEPPAKIIQRTVTPPVRLVPQQALLATQRPQFTNNNNSPKKVYIPIGAAQNQVRPGHTIMLKQVSQGQRMRSPNILPKQSAASPLRMTRIAPRHPAPLPDSMKQYQPPNWKALPPTPELKLSKVDNGIVISWKINDYQEDDHEEIASYQLYAYQETSSPPSTALWKKIGDVKALPLPMACTLTQFMSGYKYYFAVRAVDIRSRLGPFSLPGSILLLNKM